MREASPVSMPLFNLSVLQQSSLFVAELGDKFLKRLGFSGIWVRSRAGYFPL
jgi:hypothetical protein